MACKVIGFGGLAGAGKTTAAAMAENLIARGLARRHSFAARVKQIAKADFGWDGKKDDRGRRLLQVIGTEAGREYNPDLWIRYVAYQGRDYTVDNIIIVDDCRFPNEADWCNAHGTTVILIRDGAGLSGQAGQHSSEKLLDECAWKYVIHNNGTEGQLYDQIKQVLKLEGFIT